MVNPFAMPMPIQPPFISAPPMPPPMRHFDFRPGPNYIPLDEISDFNEDVETMKRHLELRDGRFYLNRTTYEADLYYRDKEYHEEQVRDAIRRGVPHAKVTDESEAGYEGMDPTRPFRTPSPPKRKDEKDGDRDQGGAGAAMMVNESAGTTSGKQGLYISFIADSGACDHIIRHKHLLVNFRDKRAELRSASQDGNLRILGEGDLLVKSNVGLQMPFRLKNVQFSPNISENLCSLRKFTEIGYTIELDANKLKIHNKLTDVHLLEGKYEAPYWMIDLDLIRPADLDVECAKYKERLSSFTDSAVLNTGDPVASQSGGVGEIESHKDSEAQHPQSNAEQIEVNETQSSDTVDANLSQLDEQNTPQDAIKDSNTTKQVNPSVNMDTLGLDMPMVHTLQNQDENSPIDVERFQTTINENLASSSKFKPSVGYIWHTKLGHASIHYLKELQKRDSRLKDVIFDETIKNCEVCTLAKFSKLPFTETRLRAFRPLQIIHADLMGPIKPTTFPGQCRFISVFVDDFSRFAMAYAMTTKSETGMYLERFINSARNMLGKEEKVCILQSDQGTEFTGGYTKEVLEREKIDSKLAPPCTPQHNGVAERFNRTLVEKIRAMILDSGFPMKRWDIVLRAAIFLYNRTPHRSNNFEIPIRKFAPHHPCHVDQLKRFGCVGYMKVANTANQPKFGSKVVQVIFAGYLATGFLLFHPTTETFFESKHVRFRESLVYRNVYTCQNTENLEVTFDEDATDQKESQPTKRIESLEITTESHIQNTLKRSADTPPPTKSKIQKQLIREEILTRSKTKLRDSSFKLLFVEESQMEGVYFMPYHEEKEMKCLESHDELHHKTLANVNKDPTSFADAMSRPDREHWKKAIEIELQAMERNKVWEYVDRPKNCKVIDSKWVFKTKLDHGIVIYKGRCVIRGFKDENEYELRETYAPVARSSTVKANLAIINKNNLDVNQMDVVGAFLNGPIYEDIYMEIPLGVNCTEEFRAKKVCKLKKAIYGLKISSQRWNQHFTDVIKELGFEVCPNDPCLFKWQESDKVAFLLLYVDDMLISSNCPNKLKTVKEHLERHFEMKDLGPPQKFLGSEIQRDRNNNVLKISQKSYIDKILDRFHMTDCRQHATPMVTKSNPIKHSQTEKEVVEAPYREAIGSMLYLSGGTRPDLSYAINVLSRKQVEPTEEDWIAVKRTFRYCKGTRDLELTYRGVGEELEVFTDSSFGDCENSHSTSGYIIKLFGDTIAWRSHKQNFVAMSTCEAEYASMSEGCMEVIAIHKVVSFLLNQDLYPITLWCDNRAAVNCVSLGQPPRLRHCLFKNFDYVKEAERENRIKVKWVSTDGQLADIMTKPLPQKTHDGFREKILNT